MADIDFFDFDEETGKLSSKIFTEILADDMLIAGLSVNDYLQFTQSIEYLAYRDAGLESKYLERCKAIISETKSKNHYSEIIDGLSKITEFSLPEGVKYIDSSAFAFCSSLETIHIQDGVLTIGYNAFSGTAIKKIYIPKSVNFIAPTAFENMKNLTEIDVDEDNLTYVSLNGNLYSMENLDNDGGLILVKFARCEDTKYDLSKDIEKLTDLDGNQGVFITSLGNWSFCGCSLLETLDIPSEVEYIGNWAFWGCSSLSSINISDDATFVDIGDGAFARCRSLASFNIPKGIESIPNYAFYECVKLQSVKLPAGITSIGERAFFGCAELTSVTIPNTVKSIRYQAFLRCKLDNLLIFENPNDWAYTDEGDVKLNIDEVSMETHDANALLKYCDGNYGIRRCSKKRIVRMDYIYGSKRVNLYNEKK